MPVVGTTKMKSKEYYFVRTTEIQVHPCASAQRKRKIMVVLGHFKSPTLGKGRYATGAYRQGGSYMVFIVKDTA